MVGVRLNELSRIEEQLGLHAKMPDFSLPPQIEVVTYARASFNAESLEIARMLYASFAFAATLEMCFANHL